MLSHAHWLNKDRKILLLLFLCSCAIYLAYFHHVLLHLNSLLSSITGDALKNYYTYAYHIVHDAHPLHFSGMNYPYGEHVIYTDCQPLLTFILRALPFCHDYIIGILHFLIFFSFILTPPVLYKALRSFGTERLVSFFSALAVALLSPQFAKINGGHHGLAYGCVIPLAMLILGRYAETRRLKWLLILPVYNFALFFLHPYIGFGLALFAFFALIFYALMHRAQRGRHLLMAFLTGILPMAGFKLFMLVTDHHLNRTVRPYGQTALVENVDSLLAPDFGPLMPMMNSLFPDKIRHFEGHSYLGFFTILLSLLFIVTLIIHFRKIRVPPMPFAIFVSSFLLLLLSFGIHTRLLDALHLDSASLSQFRAASRFAWFFYFGLPVLLVTGLCQVYRQVLPAKKFFTVSAVLSILYFLTSFTEAHFYFRLDKEAFWKFDNLFSRKMIRPETEKILKGIRLQNPQAIITLPVFYLGSEMYDRIGSDKSMIPAMICSFHTKVPILGAWMSRTSISETAHAIEVLNSYKSQRPLMARLNDRPFSVIVPVDQLMPDEERFLEKVTLTHTDDSLKLGYITKKDLMAPARPQNPVVLDTLKHVQSANLVYIPFENRKPFVAANFMDYEKPFVLDSNTVRSGSWILSFHFHYTREVFRSVACNLIITRGIRGDYQWLHNRGISVLSGYYDGFGVFEYGFEVEDHARYEFLIKGNVDQEYKISNFMLRRKGTDVVIHQTGRDSSINNFPVRTF